MLGYFYTGHLEVSVETALPLLTIADLFQCTSLVAKLIEYIENNAREVTRSEHFLNLTEDALISIVSSDR